MNLRLCAILICLWSCTDKKNDPWQIFVASSLHQNTSNWLHKNQANQQKFLLQSASSHTLMNWVRYGKKADWVIVANDRYIKELQSDPSYQWSIPLICNQIVIAYDQKHTHLTQLDHIADYIEYTQSMAIAQPKVPLGIYTQSVLKQLQLTDEAPIKVQSNSATQALNYLQLGEVESAIIYYNNAVQLSRRKPQFTFVKIPSHLSPPIIYYLVALSERAKHSIPDATSLKDYLSSVNELYRCIQ